LDKETLLKAARKAFLKQGFKKTNVAQICTEAGIATGSFYKFFKSKEEIFLVLYDRENDILRKNLIREIDQQTDLIKTIDVLLDYVFAHVRQNAILLEWYRPTIGPKLHEYYAQQIAAGDYSFSVYLQKRLAEINVTLSPSGKEALAQLVQFIDYMDKKFDSAGFVTYTGTFRKMVSAYLEKYVIGDVK
jgi:Transcriptional regulator